MSRLLIFGPAPGRGPEGVPPFSGRSGAFLARLVGTSSFEEIRARAVVRNVLLVWLGKSGRGGRVSAERGSGRCAPISG